MKRLTALALLAAATVLAAGNVKVSEGSRVSLRFAETVSSANARLGQTVLFEVSRDVVVSGVAVIRSGSEGWGVVLALAPPGRMGRDGQLEIELQGVCLADGSAVRLRAAGDAAQSRAATDEEESRSGALYALPALPVMAFVYGDDVTARAGQEVQAVLAETRRLDSRAVQASGPVRGCRRSADAPGGASQVAVRSNPAGAEIRVDGLYFGDTPSTLNMAPGNHHIEVVKPGFLRWERTIAITAGGAVTVSAALERETRAEREE